jgi:hypothetical protein
LTTLDAAKSASKAAVVIPPQFRGAWGPNAKACSPGPDQLDVVEQGGIRIDGKRIGGYETSTELVRAVSSAPASFTFRGRTSDETAEGEGELETVTLRLIGGKLSFGGHSYVRCSR